ncbi:hypothetical protein KAR91_33050 [Candidatus Pacearchaeota archaeon]|nr:hypothetical protein [Candidatus Pacearchaeota archaeon]
MARVKNKNTGEVRQCVHTPLYNGIIPEANGGFKKEDWLINGTTEQEKAIDDSLPNPEPVNPKIALRQQMIENKKNQLATAAAIDALIAEGKFNLDGSLKD